MHFPTLEFLMFFGVVLLILHKFKGKIQIQKIILLCVNLLFYSLFDVRFSYVLIALIVVNYLLYKYSRDLFSSFPKFSISFFTILNILALIIFKYYDFVRFNLETLFANNGISLHIPLLEIMVPIGISFYIFRFISFQIDNYRGLIKKEDVNFLNFSLYVTYFPQILSGPIMKFNDFVSQLSNLSEDLDSKEVSNALSRIILGMFKKLVVVTILTEKLVGPIFDFPEQSSWISLWVGMYAYAVVIFMDFSGYVDLSNGISRLIGIKSPENFDKPYLSFDIQEFWRKWHMSLSTWVKDYIYIPLGGNRKGVLRQLLNTIIAMSIVGLWHGVGVSFLLWGFVQGILIAIAVVSKNHRYFTNVPIFLKYVFTFHLVCFSWIIFASDNTSTMMNYFRGLINFNYSEVQLDYLAVVILIASLLLHPFEKQMVGLLSLTQKFGYIFQSIVFGFILLLIFYLGPDTVPDFIYYRF